MTRTVAAFAGVVLVAASIAAAQTTPPLPRPTPPASPGTTRQADPPTVTVTGCLKPWDAAMTPSAGAPAGAAAGRFLLTNLEPSASSTTAPGKVTEPPPAPNTQYVVTADRDVNLAAHVNHKVRIEGRVAMKDAAASTAQTRPGDDAGADRWTGLSATSVTMVAATCTGASH